MCSSFYDLLFSKLKSWGYEMKREIVIFQIKSFTLNLCAIVLISACTAPALSQVEVQRPSIITLPPECYFVNFFILPNTRVPKLSKISVSRMNF